MVEVKTGERQTTPEFLQKQFFNLLRKLHRLTYKAYGAEGEFADTGHASRQTPLARAAAIELAEAVTMGFPRLYSQLPEGYHLKIGLTPGRYQKFAGNSETQLFCSIEDTEAGMTYWLSVGRRVEDQGMTEKGRNILNIVGVGTNDPYHPWSRFDLQMVGKELRKPLESSIYPQDILAIKVNPNI